MSTERHVITRIHGKEIWRDDLLQISRVVEIMAAYQIHMLASLACLYLCILIYIKYAILPYYMNLQSYF